MRYLALFVLAVLISGCASAPEVYTLPSEFFIDRQVVIEDDRPQIELGRPNALIDGLNHYLLSLPAKALLWNWQILDHEFPPDHKRILDHYLELNSLRSVKVRHNQYAPIDEFRRLRRNKEVGAGYRYTLGLITWLRYTLLPDRLLGGLPFIGGGDHFNPFTNSINVFSSDLGVLLHEAGHAKDYLQHQRRGTTFAALRLLPGIDLIQEAKASNDAIRYLYCIRHKEGELRAYKTLIPAYSTYVGGYFSGGLLVTLPIVTAGHITGSAQSAVRRRALIAEAESPPSAITREDFLPPFCRPVLSPAPDDEIDVALGLSLGLSPAVQNEQPQSLVPLGTQAQPQEASPVRPLLTTPSRPVSEGQSSRSR